MNFYSMFSFSPPLKLKIAPSHQVNLPTELVLHKLYLCITYTEFVVFIVVFAGHGRGASVPAKEKRSPIVKVEAELNMKCEIGVSRSIESHKSSRMRYFQISSQE